MAARLSRLPAIPPAPRPARFEAGSSRTILVSVGSGKGGVGKSVIAANVALSLARGGRRVVLADLDIGGANQHILFGILNPARTLSDFLAHRVESLEEVALPVSSCQSLLLVPGTGETLATANLSFSGRMRIISGLREMNADVVVVDVGPGANYHSLDFFLMGDVRLAVSTPDPTSVLDLYRFIKLAAIRRVLRTLAPSDSRQALASELSDGDYGSVEEVLDAVSRTDAEGRRIAQTVLTDFRPCLVMNRIAGRSFNTRILKSLLKEYVGSDLAVMGEVPEDEAVGRSVRTWLPVVDSSPDSPAARALSDVSESLVAEIERSRVERSTWTPKATDEQPARPAIPAVAPLPGLPSHLR